jgi:hypothetical protein
MSPTTPKSVTLSRLAQDRRRAVVQAADQVFGIDEVQLITSDDSAWLLHIRFISKSGLSGADVVPPTLNAEHFELSDALSGAPSPLFAAVVLPGATSNTIVVELGSSLEWDAIDPTTVYRLSISDVPGVDAQFSFAEFGLNPVIRVPHDRLETVEQTRVSASPSTYLCKDYSSFRSMMLDRLQRSASGWKERSPADLGVTLVEAVSHVADTLSYYQDAVGTEAYLDTARQRTSIRRHARLTDQRISEGAGARTWLQFEVSEDVSVPAGTMAGTAPQAVRRATLGSTENLVFRTSRALWAVVEQNQMIPYTWGVVPMTLPEGATSMSLNGHLTSLRAGDVLILEAIGGLNGALIRQPIRLVEDAQLDFDAARQSPITRIRWGHSDALSNPFHLDDSPGSPSTTVVRGNNVLSEQGEFLSVPNRDLNADFGALHIQMQGQSILCVGLDSSGYPASEQRLIDPFAALPAIKVVQTHPSGRNTVFEPVPDLLLSEPMDAHFVVEVSNNGDVRLRFGDGRQGRPCPALGELRVALCPGDGGAGNVGADALTELHSTQHSVLAVRNPIAATGGCNAQSLEAARQHLLNGRPPGRACVDPEDYATLAASHPQVREARAVESWGGSWPVVTVHILPEHGDRTPDELRVRLQRRIDAHRRIGVQVDVRAAVVVHVDISLKLKVSPKRPLSAIRKQVMSAIGLGLTPFGGYFHSAKWGFGRPVYDAPVIRMLSELDGIEWVEELSISRRDNAESVETPGVIAVRAHEVIRLSRDGLRLVLEVAS